MYSNSSVPVDGQRSDIDRAFGRGSTSAVDSSRANRTSTNGPSNASYGALLEDFSALSLQSRKEPEPSPVPGQHGTHWGRNMLASSDVGGLRGPFAAHHRNDPYTSYAGDMHQRETDGRQAQAGNFGPARGVPSSQAGSYASDDRLLGMQGMSDGGSNAHAYEGRGVDDRRAAPYGAPYAGGQQGTRSAQPGYGASMRGDAYDGRFGYGPGYDSSAYAPFPAPGTGGPGLGMGLGGAGQPQPGTQQGHTGASHTGGAVASLFWPQQADTPAGSRASQASTTSSLVPNGYGQHQAHASTAPPPGLGPASQSFGFASEQYAATTTSSRRHGSVYSEGGAYQPNQHPGQHGEQHPGQQQQQARETRQQQGYDGYRYEPHFSSDLSGGYGASGQYAQPPMTSSSYPAHGPSSSYAAAYGASPANPSPMGYVNTHQAYNGRPLHEPHQGHAAHFPSQPSALQQQGREAGPEHLGPGGVYGQGQGQGQQSGGYGRGVITTGLQKEGAGWHQSQHGASASPGYGHAASSYGQGEGYSGTGYAQAQAQAGYATQQGGSAYAPSVQTAPAQGYGGQAYGQGRYASAPQHGYGGYGAPPTPTHGHSGVYGSNSGGQQGAHTSLPEGVLPSSELRKLFAESQWQLLRILLVRRFAAVTGVADNGTLSRDNVRAAAQLFGLQLAVNSIVSKPHKYSIGDLVSDSPSAGSGQGWRRGGRGSGTDSASQAAPLVFTDLPDMDLAQPTSIVITAQDLQRLPTSGLPEAALGWWGTASTPDGKARAHGVASPRAARLVSEGSDGTLSTPGALSPSGNSTTGRPLLSDLSDTAGQGSAAIPVPRKLEVVPEPVQTVSAAAVGLLAAELVSQKRFKTKLCHAWMKNGGYCPRGDRCDYAHGAEEVRGSAGKASAPTPGGAAAQGAQGVSSGSSFKGSVDTMPEPPKFKQRLCRAWLDTNGAYCPHADRCTFAHGVHELRIQLPSGRTSPRSATTARNLSQSALSPHTDHTGIEHDRDSVFSADDEDAVSGPGREGEGGAGRARVDEDGRPHRTKVQLCVAWLTGAASAAASCAASAIENGPQNADTVLQTIHSAGVARCPSGSACSYAHGIDDLRLPSVVKLHKVVREIVQTAPAGRTAAAAVPGKSSRSGSVTADPATGLIVRAQQGSTQSHALSGADQTLLFVASGVALASLPNKLVDMMRYLVRTAPVAVSVGSLADPLAPSPSSSSALAPRVDGRISDPSTGLSSAGQAAVAVAASSPITALLLPTLSVHGASGGSRGAGGAAAGPEGIGAAQPLSRTIATLGVAACTCGLLMAAVQLRLIDLEGQASSTFTDPSTGHHLDSLYAATRARLTHSPSEPPLHAVLSSDMLAPACLGSLGLGPGQPPSHPAGGRGGQKGANSAGRYGSLQLWKRSR